MAYMFKMRIGFYVLLIFCLLSYINCFSATIVPTTNNNTANSRSQPNPIANTDNKIDYKAINNQLTSIENSLLKKDISIPSTTEYIVILNNIQNTMLNAKQVTESELDLLQKRVDALGEKPKDGVKEPATIASKRREFQKEEDSLKTKIAETELALAKVDELEKLILSIRNKILLSNILNRQQDFIYPNNFIKNSESFTKFIYSLLKSPVDWYRGLTVAQKQSIGDHFTYKIIALTIIILLSIASSIFIKHRFGYRDTGDKVPDYIKKIITATMVLISKIVIPGVIIGVFLFLARHSAIIDVNHFKLVASSFLVYLLYVVVVMNLVTVVFTPKYSVWRLISVSDRQAKALSFSIKFSAIAIGLVYLIEYIAIKTEQTTNIIIYIKMLSSLVKVISVVFITHRSLCDYCYNNKDDNEESSKNDNQTAATTQSAIAISGSEEEDNYGELTFPEKIKITIYLYSITVIGVGVLGFINLSDYILSRTLCSAIIISIGYIISNILSVLFHNLLMLSFWMKTLKIKRRTLGKLDIWFDLITNPAIAIVAIFIILNIWGVSTDLLLQNIRRFLRGFYIGGVKISITSILLGVVVFFVSMSLFKIIKIKLLVNTLSRMNMDSGARDSLASGFSFFGFLASAFFAIAVMGGSLSNLAIVAGALSFGIGLGLQNVISNFVSGILILIERPIKIGDVVNINGQTGTVKQISVRATKLETDTKTNVIIPNANIISGILLNMTNDNKKILVELKFTVDYNNNPKNVMELLLNVAKENKKVMAKPAPSVSFNNFSNDNMSFTLNCYIMDATNKQNITNDIMVSVFEKFRDENIRLPKNIVYLQDKQNNVATRDNDVVSVPNNTAETSSAKA